MKPILFCVAERAVIDERSKLLTLINFIEQYNITSFPSVLPTITVISWVELEDADRKGAEAKAVLRLNNEIIAELIVEFDVRSSKKSRSIIEVSGLSIESPGELEIRLRHGKKQMGYWKIDIVKTGQPEINNIEKPSNVQKKNKSKK